ncbi:DNA polymerase IV [Reinekea sp.]|jgi:DNA polymerase-4|uniref:DNA polymerase IV n=1 Tax=Reinekea sp. TaxID=1970455 RepID=UPI002A7EF20B|nr:DNA polymerase IV [Reinekea sp.]
MQRKIIHIDCDCYYAALEMRDFPHLRGRPIAVGGQSSRSVLSTCNYEARAFGLHSAMPSWRAQALCPQVIIQAHRFEVYRAASEQMMAIFSRYADLVEPLSLDEAYLDVSESHWFGGSATLLAEHIRAEILAEVGITVSAGVAPNKFLAKVSSDWNKPNGIFVVPPHRVDGFVSQLPVKKIWGVGEKFNQRLNQMGIKTCGDLQQWPMPKLVQFFGKSGAWLYQRARGIDERAVGRTGSRKSQSIEHTFAADLAGEEQCLSHLPLLYAGLMQRINDQDCPPLKSVFVKVRFSDFTTTTLERAWALEADSYQRLLRAACAKNSKAVRLLGLGVRFNEAGSSAQLSLWGPDESPSIGSAASDARSWV